MPMSRGARIVQERMLYNIIFLEKFHNDISQTNIQNINNYNGKIQKNITNIMKTCERNQPKNNSQGSQRSE